MRNASSSSGAFPARSPKPPMVTSACAAPARSAAMVFAVARPRSSWQCTPTHGVEPLAPPSRPRDLRHEGAHLLRDQDAIRVGQVDHVDAPASRATSTTACRNCFRACGASLRENWVRTPASRAARRQAETLFRASSSLAFSTCGGIAARLPCRHGGKASRRAEDIRGPSARRPGAPSKVPRRTDRRSPNRSW